MWSVRKQMGIVWATMRDDWRHSTLGALVWEHSAAYVQTNDKKKKKSILLCSVIVCKVPADQAGLVTGQESHNITGRWQWWRLKPSLMEQQQGMGLCQRASQDREDRGLEGGCGGAESELLPEKVTWNLVLILQVPTRARACEQRMAHSQTGSPSACRHTGGLKLLLNDWHDCHLTIAAVRQKCRRFACFE